VKRRRKSSGGVVVDRGGHILAWWWIFQRWLPRRISRWDALCRKFPATNIH